MGSVSWRKRGNRYLVSWRLDDGSQGGKTVDTPDEARDLAAENGWRCAAAPGEEDVAGDIRSANGQMTGGRCGLLTPTAARPR